MTRIFLAAAFLISLLTLPSWTALLVAVLYLAHDGDPLLVLLGGFFLDEVFGAPIAVMHGFAYFYTLCTLILSFFAWYLRGALFE